jgi:hypothetical protein
MALTKLTSNLIEGGTGTDWVTAIQTSNFTAEAGKVILLTQLVRFYM